MVVQLIRIGFTLLLSLISLSAFSHTDKFRCMWREDPSTTIVIGWDQVSGESPAVYYGEQDFGQDYRLYPYAKSADNIIYSKGMNNHFARLFNLEPNTTYYFVLKDSEGVSRRMSFRTMPNHSDTRLSVVAGGDSRNHRTARRNANLMVAKLRPHVVLFGGDMTGGDTAREWKEWFQDWQMTIPEDGRLTPIIAARGNHEYSNRSIVELFDIRNDNVYYSIGVAGNLLKIYTLNSLIASGGAQAEWLKNDLMRSDNYSWRFAQYHYATRPHTSKKSERNNQLKNWSSLFFKHQVQLVMECDAHVVKTTWPVRPSTEEGSFQGFIRDDVNGSVYAGEGCWGAPLRRNNDDKPWTRSSGSFNQFKWVFVDQNKLEVRTIKTDSAPNTASVDPYDIFTPPAGIDIWNPPSGDVITIRSNRNGYATNISPAPVREDFELMLVEANMKDNNVAINWTTRNETSDKVVFEVQRTMDGKSYETIAKVAARGPGQINNEYEFVDKALGNSLPTNLSYRLSRPKMNGILQVYEIKGIGADIDLWKNFPELKPDENGVLRVKYRLDDRSNVNIVLLDKKNLEMAVSNYKNQQAGNYLKTIDMKRMPKGIYLLIIRSEKGILRELQIIKRD